jgi:hypothetical protein
MTPEAILAAFEQLSDGEKAVVYRGIATRVILAESKGKRWVGSEVRPTSTKEITAQQEMISHRDEAISEEVLKSLEMQEYMGLISREEVP